MIFMKPKAIDVKALSDYKIEVTFEDGKKGIFDVKPYLEFIQFKDLKNIDLFNTVKISGLSISWDNGADICPDELYNGTK
ncbi:MAG: DUF2442 domain-containing protein [Clostridia bacterium]|nr:DUF2442 domain-containing protein [Clostridia bacterium]